MTHLVQNDSAVRPRRESGDGGWVARLWRRRLLAAVVLGCCVVGGFIYLIFTPKVYESYAILSASQPTGGSASPILSTLYEQTDVIRSADVANDALSQSTIRNLSTLQDQIDPVTYIIQNLSVAVDNATSRINIGMPAKSGEDSAKIVNAIVNAYLTRRNQSLASRHVDQDSATALQKFKEANPEFITQESADSIGHRLAAMNDALAGAQVDLASAKSELLAGDAKLKYPKSSADIIKIYRPKNIFGALDSQEDDVENDLGPLEKKQAMQKQALGGQNPLVQRTQQDIDGLNSRLSDIAEQKGEILAVYLQHQYDIAAGKVKALQTQIDAQQNEAKEYVEKSGELASLEGTTATTDVHVAAAPVVLTLSQVAAATPSPISPTPVVVLSKALLLGILLGTLVGVIRF